MNNATVAAAIASAFAGVTPPAGQPALVYATYQLPQAIGATPCVLVFPPEDSFSYDPGSTRNNTQTWPVRFYLAPTGDYAAAWDVIYAWHDVLTNALVSHFTLGGMAGVNWVRVESGSPGWRLPYGDTEYVGRELGVVVQISEAVPVSG